MNYDPNDSQNQFGQQQPPYGGNDQGSASSDDRTFAMLAHLLGLIGFLGPLIILLTKGKESHWVKGEATESLNFQITMIPIWIIGSLTVIGFPVAVVLGVVFPILGAVKANGGQSYRYPFALRLVK